MVENEASLILDSVSITCVACCCSPCLEVWRTVEQFCRKLGPRAVEDLGTLWPQGCINIRALWPQGCVESIGCVDVRTLQPPGGVEDCRTQQPQLACRTLGHSSHSPWRMSGYSPHAGRRDTAAIAPVEDVGTQPQPTCRTPGHSSHSPSSGRRDTAAKTVWNVGALRPARSLEDVGAPGPCGDHLGALAAGWREETAWGAWGVLLKTPKQKALWFLKMPRNENIVLLKNPLGWCSVKVRPDQNDHPSQETDGMLIVVEASRRKERKAIKKIWFLLNFAWTQKLL